MTEIGANESEFRVVVPGSETGVIHLSWASLTDVGNRRAANEDSFIASPPIFAVADGMGGHLAGDRASAAVVNRLSEALTSDFLDPEAIERALELATDDIEIVSNGSEIGVGTTVTGAVLTIHENEPYLAVFNIGDSRVYRYEEGSLEQITVDHSLVQQMVESGLITQAQAHNHPEGNVITRAVGFQSQPTPDYWLVPLRAGLRVLVCSDGLTGEIDDERLSALLSAEQPPQQTAKTLVDAALEEGGRDNITVIVLDVIEAPVSAETGATAPGASRGAS
jgi:serine/threonine protein phosphatase PrpC